MPDPDPSVVSALEVALTSDPDSIGIRMHLAGLLVGTDPKGALAHLRRVLAAQPDHADALGLASQAAARTGDHARADAWGRLHDAVSSPPTEPLTAAEPEAMDSPPSTPGKVVIDVPPGVASERPETVVNWDQALEDFFAQESDQRTTLADVAGLEAVKERLHVSLLAPMRNRELREAYGASMRGGLLLWGPPGCGKTFLARAVAGELGAHFVSVGLHDVLDMWLGNSEKQLHGLFEAARRRSPTVLFFDEVDAIGHARADLARSASRNVVAQLLAEMDGVATDNDGVFVIGATNQPWDVDPALRRPGRLDRTMLVLPPDAPARAAILELHLRQRPTSVDSLAAVVNVTEGFSGADLRLVCDDAAQAVMTQAVISCTVRPITTDDLLEAAGRLRPSTAPWFEMAKNFIAYANTTGDYDEVAAFLNKKPGRQRR